MIHIALPWVILEYLFKNFISTATYAKLLTCANIIRILILCKFIMGKINCTGRVPSVEQIEKRLKYANSQFEKKIQDEYLQLKKYLSELDNNSTDVASNTNTTSTCRVVINYIPEKKRLERFIKWSKMLLTESLPSKEEEVEKLYDLDNTIAVNNLSKVLPLETSDLSNSSSPYEKNLRRYATANTWHFIERVSKGPPSSLRWLSWLISAKVPEERNDNILLHDLQIGITEETEQQIKKDIPRTLVDSKENLNSLYKVLKALASKDKELSYCQGMNFISGFLLNVSDFNEVETYYLLIALFSDTFSSEFGIRGFFSDNFPLLNAYLYVFDHFFEKRLPELKKHFDKLEIPKEVWIGKWIQTLYTICLPIEIGVRLWDCIWSMGLDFLISFSLALIESLWKELIKIDDCFDVIEYFREVFNGCINLKGHLTKKEAERNINIEDIITNSKRLHKSIDKKTFKAIIREFELTHNFDLEELGLKYDMSIKSTPLSINTSAIEDVITIQQSNEPEENDADSVGDEYDCKSGDIDKEKVLTHVMKTYRGINK